MADPISNYYKSIRERITREIAIDLAAHFGIGQIVRRDFRGNQYKDGQPVIVVGDDVVRQELSGNPGYVEKTMDIGVGMVVRQSESDTEASETLANRMMWAVEARIHEDPHWTESVTGVELAVDTATIATGPIPQEDGATQIVPAVSFRVTFRHDRNNPASYGTAITPIEV